MKLAIRLIPPKTINATPKAMIEAPAIGGIPQAFSAAATILLA